MPYYQKILEIKKRLCMRLRSEDKHHLKKSSSRKAQIRKAFVPLTGLICAFRSADFLRWCLSSERNLAHNLFFYFQHFFVLIWFIFSMRRRTVQPEIRSFVRCFDPLSRHLTEAKWRTRTVSKSATFLAREIVNSAPFKRGETKVQIFGKEKCKTLRQY